jgi:hypothetical protein
MENKWTEWKSWEKNNKNNAEVWQKLADGKWQMDCLGSSALAVSGDRC